MSMRIDSKNMTLDSILSKKNHVFKRSMELAAEYFSEHPGDFSSSDNDYEIARYVEDSVTLIIYPHRTKSTGNYHLRVRSEGKPNNIAKALMGGLNKLAPHEVTFCWNNLNTEDEWRFYELHKKLMKERGLEPWPRESQMIEPRALR